jgi:hypothetical protein
MSPDAVAVLHELRPADDVFDPDAPAAAASLERILAAPLPPIRARRRRPPARRLAVAAAVPAAAAAAVAVTPFVRSSPDVVARAAAALSPSDGVLHFRAEVRARESAAERRAGRPDAHVDDVVESWQGDGRARSVLRGGNEVALDTETGRGEEYIGMVNALVPIDHAQVAEGLGARSFPSGVVGDLARLLERARAGEADLRVVGEAAVRGIPAYELRLDFSVPVVTKTDATARPGRMRMSRLIYVDRESYLPLRVVERGPQGETFTVTDYVKAERLPLTDATRADLRMSPHPGARRPGPDGAIRFSDPPVARRR